jgi:hypothetical protein
MGGTSKTTQQQTSSTTPWGQAAAPLTGILNGINALVPGAGSLTGAQTGALNSIEANANAGNPYAAPTGNVAMGLLNGGGAQNNDAAIKSNLANYQGILNPIANGSQIGANSALKPALNAVSTDVTNNVNGQFAAAGRDMSPANTQALARGWATGTAPIVASQYNTDVQRMMDANAASYGAGNTTYGLLNQNQGAANANAVNGVGVGTQALDANNWGANQTLAAEAQRQGIPLQQLTTLLGSVSPVAQAFGTQNGSSSGTQTMSGAQQFATIAGGIGSLWPKNPIKFN